MACRRDRSTERGISDNMMLLSAIKAIKIDKKSVRAVAEAYNIDRKTLGRHLVKFDSEVPDVSALSDEELLYVIKRIVSYASTALTQMVCLSLL